jgi:hypothetical protein
VSGPSGEGRCAMVVVAALLAAFIGFALWALLQRPQ